MRECRLEGEYWRYARPCGFSMYLQRYGKKGESVFTGIRNVSFVVTIPGMIGLILRDNTDLGSTEGRGVGKGGRGRKTSLVLKFD